MKVNNGNSGPIRPDGPREPSAARGASKTPVAGGRTTPAPVDRLDRVEISNAGRALASKVEPLPRGTEDRIAQIRQRVLAGAYDTDTVVADVARRIIERGDL